MKKQTTLRLSVWQAQALYYLLWIIPGRLATDLRQGLGKVLK